MSRQKDSKRGKMTPERKEQKTKLKLQRLRDAANKGDKKAQQKLRARGLEPKRTIGAILRGESEPW